MTLLVLIAANGVALAVIDRQEARRNRALHDKDVEIAMRDREIAALRHKCCTPCRQTLPMLNCVPSLCVRTPAGLCCVEGAR